MTSQNNLNRFNKIYDNTYNDVLKYIIVKCHNVSDANDIIQDTYLEFWKLLNEKEIVDKNIKSFLISIASNKIKKHYSLVKRLKTISIFSKNNNNIELMDILKDNLNIEELIIKQKDWTTIWTYLKKKKNQDIPKIFILYYKYEMTIKEISKQLEKSESYIKNNIYRTLKELKDIFGKENNYD